MGRRYAFEVESIAEGRRFWFILLAILAIALAFRIDHISCDAPIGFTKSQDINTDPFAYTYFAKNLLDHGDSNPFDDPRWIVYQKSTQTAAACLVYTVFGTGRDAGNLTAVLLNLLAVFLIALGLKKYGFRLGALIFALIAAINYTLIVFARIPFLEASQNLWLAASFYFFSRAQKRSLFMVLTGVASAAAAFFGKMTGLPSVLMFLACFFFMYITIKDRKSVLRSTLVFCAGYAGVVLFWLLFTYLPSAAEVSHYYQEQGVGLYGTPKAFKGVVEFFQQAFSLLWERNYFEKLPIVTLLAAIAGAAGIWKVGVATTTKKFDDWRNVGWIVMIVWVVVGFCVLFPFNYRPLRYQTTLMFPMMAMGGVLLAELATLAKNVKREKGRRKVPTLWNSVLGGIWLAPVIALLYLSMVDSPAGAGLQKLYGSTLMLTIVFVAVGAGLAYMFSRVVPYMPSFAFPLRFVVLALILGYGLIQVLDYTNWMSTREYTLISADRDIGAILPANAVLSGSYATALTQENKLKCVHHQFGVQVADKEFFQKYPITHLAVDPGNEQRAREDYPEMMADAALVSRYTIRGYPVSLFRIAESSGNPQTAGYKPSDFERMVDYLGAGELDSAQTYLGKLQQLGLKSMSFYTVEGDLAASSGNDRDAIKFYSEAYGESELDAMLAYRLGAEYYRKGSSAGYEAYQDSALKYLEVALKRMPADKNLESAVNQLRRAVR